MTAAQHNDDLGTAACHTCRGWSCMKCVQAIDHDRCAMDCPDCYDSRNVIEQEWLPVSDLRAITGDSATEARATRRSHRTRDGWQAHRIHRLQARCAG